MFDYSKQIEAFRDAKVRLKGTVKQKLYDHRDSNRDRLMARLPLQIDGVRIARSSFKPQGSMAIDTIVQTKFKYEEYDIDDGLVLLGEDLIDENGEELSSAQVRAKVVKALRDKRFVKQPKLVSNAVRVFYKEEDDQRHHIDIPIYRKFDREDGNTVRELAGEKGWVESDPTQVNKWFNDQVEKLNKECDGKGTQLRRLIQLLKRFCRSRDNWDMPSGIKLTMLVSECQPVFSERVDEAFRELLEEIQERLRYNKVIRNLAHPERPRLTRSDSDSNVEELADKVANALQELSSLDQPDRDDEKSARSSWDWVFKTDGFFKDYDAKQSRLVKKITLINSQKAKTNPAGVITSAAGVANTPHQFYGESF